MTSRTMALLSGLTVAGAMMNPAAGSDTIQVEVRLPDPPLEEMRIDEAGNVTSLKFRGEEAIADPNVDLKELVKIDLLEFYDSLVDSVIMRDANGIVFNCLKLKNTDCIGFRVVDYADLYFGADGLLAEIKGADGTVASKPTLNLATSDIENVDVLDVRSYKLIEYRDPADGQVLRRIIEP